MLVSEYINVEEVVRCYLIAALRITIDTEERDNIGDYFSDNFSLCDFSMKAWDQAHKDVYTFLEEFRDETKKLLEIDEDYYCCQHAQSGQDFSYLLSCELGFSIWIYTNHGEEVCSIKSGLEKETWEKFKRCCKLLKERDIECGDDGKLYFI